MLIAFILALQSVIYTYDGWSATIYFSEEMKDHGKASRLPLVLWVVFGGAGLILLFVRYGRR